MRRLLGVGIVLLGGCTALVDLDGFADGPPRSADAAQDGATADAPVESGANDAGPIEAGSIDAGDGGSDVTTGLVGRWRLDETSGTVAADTSGQSNTGTIEGATWTYGPVAPQGALAFDGANDYVSIGGTRVYATTSAPFSFSAWFNLVDLSVNVRDIMQLRSDSTSPWHVIVASHPDYQGISLGAADSWIPIKTGVVPEMNAWHHLAVIYDGQGPGDLAHFAIYLDGIRQLVATAAGYGTQTNVSVIGATSPIGNPWNGRLREVRIYNRALGADEVAALSTAK